MFGVFPAAFLQAFRVRPVLHLKRRYLPEPARPAQGICVRYRKITGRIAAFPDVTGCIGSLSCRYVFHLRKRIPIHALDAGKSPDPVLRAPPEIGKLSSVPPFLTVHGLACNVLRLGVVADFYHKSLIEALHLNLPQNCHTKHCTRHYAKPLL